jgi:formiminoglutamase
MNLTEIIRIISDEERTNLVKSRDGETRMGDRIHYVKSDESAQLATLPALGIRYVVLGIPECIGPMANYGKQGSQFAWDAFLGCFLNMQWNMETVLPNTAMLGSVCVDDLMEIALTINPKDEKYMDNLRQLCVELDARVYTVIKAIFDADLIPLIIGGGHNNAYPIIKAIRASKAVNPMVVNCDAHADCRALEGRHSGNPFSYALREDMLDYYHVIGLHKAYNNQFTFDFLTTEKRCSYRLYEEITNWEEELSRTIMHLSRHNKPLGIELDMDSIAFMPSSAMSPEGINLAQARQYVRKMAMYSNLAYLHLPEAAPIDDKDHLLVGKSLAYLVSDFLMTVSAG